MLGQIALISKVSYHISEYLSIKIGHIRNKKRGEEEKEEIEGECREE